ncbi:hypothetical protein EDC96DRAFT_528841 [Choanephora cucurbitarum]|nr:hypothetical protein EDC96DRAFT_528841 [Choanephora cucurbitarum]
MIFGCLLVMYVNLCFSVTKSYFFSQRVNKGISSPRGNAYLISWSLTHRDNLIHKVWFGLSLSIQFRNRLY